MAYNLLQNSNIAFSKPHSWFLELLYLIINGSIHSVVQPNHKNTNLGVIPKTNSNETQLCCTEILSLYWSSSPKNQEHCIWDATWHALQTKRRNFTLALRALAGMIWLIKARKQISHQNVFPSVLSGEILHGSSIHDCTERFTVPSASGMSWLNQVMGQWWQRAIHIFKTQCWEHQYTYQNGLYPSGTSVRHWNVNHLTNQAQISFHYECSRKPIPFSPSKRLHLRVIWV